MPVEGGAIEGGESPEAVQPARAQGSAHGRLEPDAAAERRND